VDLRNGFWTLRWPDRKAGPYQVALRLAKVAHRLEVVEIAVGSVKDDLPISGTKLREIRVAELATEVAHIYLSLGVDLGDVELANASELGPDFGMAGGRPEFERAFAARDRELLATVPRAPVRSPASEVVRIYDEAVQRRQPPTKAVATALGISYSAAAKRVATARRNGQLPPTRRGRRAGNRRKENR